MKAVCFLCALFCGLIWGTETSAQMVDMRAYSRQRGFKAYKSGSVSKPTVKRKAVQNSAETAKQKHPGESTGKKEQPSQSAQTQEMQEYIQNNPHVRPDI